MNGEPWTKERDAELVELRERGLTFGQIAWKLGVSRNAVASAVGRLGLMGSAQRVREEKQPKPVPKEKVPLLAIRGPVLTNLTAQAKAVLDLEPHHCRWPTYGDDMPFMFCGRTKQDGSSYCMYHYRASRRGVANR